MKKIFYIINSKGVIEEVPEEKAIKQPTYGVRLVKYGHTYLSHTNCDETNCIICELSCCMVCGAHEGGLTTDCCGEHLSIEEIDEVYSGKRDYRYGKWLEGVVCEGMTWSYKEALENNKKILELFKEEIKSQSNLGLKIKEDIVISNNAWIKAANQNIK